MTRHLTALRLLSPQAMVFLMLGQSNSRGGASLATLQVGYDIGPLPRIFFFNGTNFVSMDADDNGASNQYPQITDAFGAEFAMATRLRDHYSKDIYIVKHAVGGTSLYSDWKIGGSTLGDFNTTWAAAKIKLDAIFMDYAISGLIWTQGERDAKDEAYADAYEVNFGNMLTNIETTLGISNLPIICNKTNTNLPAIDYPYTATVRAAQTAVMATESHYYLVDTDTYSLQGDSVHFDAAGVEAMGVDNFDVFEGAIP